MEAKCRAKWELVTLDLSSSLVPVLRSIKLSNTCSWIPVFCGDCAQLLKKNWAVLYAWMQTAGQNGNLLQDCY